MFNRLCQKSQSLVNQSKSFVNHVLIPNIARKAIISCWRAFPLSKHRSYTPLALNTDELLIASLFKLALLQDRVMSTNSALMISIRAWWREIVISWTFVFFATVQLDYYFFQRGETVVSIADQRKKLVLELCRNQRRAIKGCGISGLITAECEWTTGGLFTSILRKRKNGWAACLKGGCEWKHNGSSYLVH